MSCLEFHKTCLYIDRWRGRRKSGGGSRKVGTKIIKFNPYNKVTKYTKGLCFHSIALPAGFLYFSRINHTLSYQEQNSHICVPCTLGDHQTHSAGRQWWDSSTGIWLYF